MPDEARIAAVARDGAAARLRNPECIRLLADFRDAQGRTLRENVERLGVSADEYLLQLPLFDGTGHPLCRYERSQLLAVPAEARILVCRPFLKTVFRNRVLAEAFVIHEMLHTLGLGENPPTSHEITQQVLERCGP